MHPVIVFDLDGTLVDSLPDILNSFLLAFEAEGLPAPSEGAARATVGQPLDAMYRVFAPEERVAELCRHYRRHYGEHLTDRTAAYPGVRELLRELGARGYLRAVASTKRSDTARKLVEATGLMPLLDHVEGTDAAPYKPAPDVVLRAIAAAGGQGLWMVGDTAGDVLAGKAAGLKTYAVSWGTHDAGQLAAAGPDVLEPDLAALSRLLR